MRSILVRVNVIRPVQSDLLGFIAHLALELCNSAEMGTSYMPALGCYTMILFATETEVGSSTLVMSPHNVDRHKATGTEIVYRNPGRSVNALTTSKYGLMTWWGVL